MPSPAYNSDPAPSILLALIHSSHSMWCFNTKRKWIDLVWFYGISMIVGYLMPTLFLYLYNKYIGFGLLGFYSLSTIGAYSMPNPLYLYIYIYIYIYIIYIYIYIYVCVCVIWFGWILWHISSCRLFHNKSSLYIYIYIYIYFVDNILKWAFFFVNGFKYYYITVTI